ncbi:hypothetical protein [Methylobacterium sp. NEAU K]|uniref:hypothetical protein n=1 Tax=Methylobacterium sp. NEAU K TaxID=3064946 RepID=UPI002734D45B|nr:hypothetical protein [Methylobacterium sp. NEAU K]
MMRKAKIPRRRPPTGKTPLYAGAVPVRIHHVGAAQGHRDHHAQDPPPVTVSPAVVYWGKPFRQPTMTRPGSTKTITEGVPAAEATV